MSNWVVTFLVLALIAGVFGFGGIATQAAGFAKVLFFVFLILTFVNWMLGRRRLA